MFAQHVHAVCEYAQDECRGGVAQRAGAGAVQEGKSEAAHGRHFSGTAAYRVSHFSFLVV